MSNINLGCKIQEYVETLGLDINVFFMELQAFPGNYSGIHLLCPTRDELEQGILDAQSKNFNSIYIYL